MPWILTGAVPGGDSKDDGDIQEDGNRASKSPWKDLVALRDSMPPWAGPGARGDTAGCVCVAGIILH